MKVAITGGTGLVGKKLTNILQNNGYEVTILTRSETDLSSSPAKNPMVKRREQSRTIFRRIRCFY
ncbi:NAD-dependent epimerase/dehydratase family protein [Kurthia senegalensis]|uniref:NAD-dependent epimerase/dehydratase family protein n=1 Tax=Kurthia senegalensis TaxID=1033740 RepID=UPI0002899F60|nr:NAD-dependent epimerase/dehydratase family protein [Kurthia senegalensis]